MKTYNMIKFIVTNELEMMQLHMHNEQRVLNTCNNLHVQINLKPQWRKANDGHMFRVYSAVINNEKTVLIPMHYKMTELSKISDLNVEDSVSLCEYKE